MRVRRLSTFLGLSLAVFCSLFGERALAATPSLTATNVAMPLSGNGSSQFTVTGLGVGDAVIVGCKYTGTQVGSVAPVCPANSSIYSVPASGVLTGTIVFSPPAPAAVAGRQGLRRGRSIESGQPLLAGLALAGALMLGHGLRRRGRRWPILTVLAVWLLAGLVGISGCTGSVNGMTPGTYQYTISAVDSPCAFLCALTGLPINSATITVTVP